MATPGTCLLRVCLLCALCVCVPRDLPIASPIESLLGGLWEGKMTFKCHCACLSFGWEICPSAGSQSPGEDAIQLLLGQ